VKKELLIIVNKKNQRDHQRKSPSMTKPTNKEVAKVLRHIAELLEAQGADPFRINAYRKAAAQIKGMDRSVSKIESEGGAEALRELPTIGKSIASVITDYLHKGTSSLLQRLQGEVNPEELFAEVPGIGRDLAERIVDELDIHSLPELEQAAHDGRLEEIEGFGKKRVQAVRSSLAGMLSGFAQRSARERTSKKEAEALEPPVKMLLQIDKEYQEKAEAGELKKIAPKRFNPDNKAWLPIYHTEKDGWDFTALFSNTKRAHELGRTDDWVVIYYEKDGGEDQGTAVTAQRGPLVGKRVIRGREKECREYYSE
jgi:DNA polymerase (family 10)